MSKVDKNLEDLRNNVAARGTVSMRELNQKTRSVIDRVAGESIALTVTDRGHPVAELHPVVPKTGLDLLKELGVVSGRGERFEAAWKPIEGVETTAEDFRDQEQDESWMEELTGRPPTPCNDGAVAHE